MPFTVGIYSSNAAEPTVGLWPLEELCLHRLHGCVASAFRQTCNIRLLYFFKKNNSAPFLVLCVKSDCCVFIFFLMCWENQAMHGGWTKWGLH